MKDCNIELQDKIDAHKDKGVMCGPSCWCWPAQGTICLYLALLKSKDMMKCATCKHGKELRCTSGYRCDGISGWEVQK